MTSVFADTSFFQALLNPRDAWHRAACAFSDVYDAEIVTSDYVLLELGALMARGPARRLFTGLIGQLSEDGASRVVPAATEHFQAGLDLFSKREDKEWSLTDCVSFAMMERYGLTDALTSDHHFEQAGFRTPLRQ